MKTLAVSVVYARPEEATEIELSLPAGSNVADALRSSGIAERHPEVDLVHCVLGVFGKHVERSTLLADGDRVEIYRPLTADPKDARRRRAGRRRTA